MTIERYRPQDEPDPGDEGMSRPRRRPDHLEELRRRTEQHGQVARDAIRRIASSANPEHLLHQLKNQGGQ
jgi:hypothetical protein